MKRASSASEGPRSANDAPTPGPGRGRRKRKSSGSDWRFFLVAGLVVFGGGFLVARFVLGMPVWQSILVAPIAFVALVLALVTWSWFTPVRRR